VKLPRGQRAGTYIVELTTSLGVTTNALALTVR
jgi:hypothetical protein